MSSPLSESAEAADRFYADNYERLYSSYLSDRRLVDSLCSFLSQKLVCRNTLLVDMGCGIGSQLKQVAKALSIPMNHCYGIDNSPSMRLRFEAMMRDTGAVLLPENLVDPGLPNKLWLHARDKTISDVVFLCLGNVIGRVEQKEYMQLANLVTSAPRDLRVVSIFEYRDGEKYRAVCPTKRYRGSDKASSVNYGTAEVIGQHDSDFFAFYIRNTISKSRYSVKLFALSTNQRSKKTECSVYGMDIQDGYYVNINRLKTVFSKAGLHPEESFSAASSLEQGETIMFTRSSHG